MPPLALMSGGDTRRLICFEHKCIPARHAAVRQRMQMSEFNDVVLFALLGRSRRARQVYAGHMMNILSAIAWYAVVVKQVVIRRIWKRMVVKAKGDSTDPTRFLQRS